MSNLHKDWYRVLSNGGQYGENGQQEARKHPNCLEQFVIIWFAALVIAEMRPESQETEA